MFVANIIFLPGIPYLFFPGASSKILVYCYGGRVLYNGRINASPQVFPNRLSSSLTSAQAFSISSSPVKKIKISPGGYFVCISTTVLMTA
jgi:hypothetical protein